MRQKQLTAWVSQVPSDFGMAEPNLLIGRTVIYNLVVFVAFLRAHHVTSIAILERRR